MTIKRKKYDSGMTSRKARRLAVSAARGSKGEASFESPPQSGGGERGHPERGGGLYPHSIICAKRRTLLRSLGRCCVSGFSSGIIVIVYLKKREK